MMLVGDCVIGTKTKLLDGASSSDREEKAYSGTLSCRNFGRLNMT